MLAIVLILLAAVANASASVLQRRAAQEEPDHREFTVGLLFDLVRRPTWLGGITAMVVGFLLQAAALTVGRIALVQPLLVVELPLTLLLATRVFHTSLSRREWVALGALAAGLAAFVFSLAPQGGDVQATPLAAWLVGVGAVGALVIGLVVAGARTHGQPRAALLGVSVGLAFGLIAALVAGIGAAWTVGGLSAVATAWQTWVVIVVGPLSFFLLQNAMQAGTLVASQPGFTLVNPLVGVLWGLFVFAEQAHGGLWLAGSVLGAADPGHRRRRRRPSRSSWPPCCSCVPPPSPPTPARPQDQPATPLPRPALDSQRRDAGTVIFLYGTGPPSRVATCPADPRHTNDATGTSRAPSPRAVRCSSTVRSSSSYRTAPSCAPNGPVAETEEAGTGDESHARIGDCHERQTPPGPADYATRIQSPTVSGASVVSWPGRRSGVVGG